MFGGGNACCRHLGLEEYRFVNLNQVTLREAYERFVHSGEQLSDHLHHWLEHGGVTLSSILKLSACMTLCSSDTNLNIMNIVKFLDWVSTLQ